MAFSIQNTLKSASRYAATHPKTLGQIARYALSRRIAIPLDALRWLVTQLPTGGTAPSDVTVQALSPALGLGASVDLMGTGLRVDGAVHIDHIHAAPGELTVTLRMKNLKANVTNNPDGNLAKLLKSGVLNLGKPASMLNFIPKKPPLIVDAKDDTFVLDLMKLPAVAANPTILKVLDTLTPVLSVEEVRAENDLLLIGLKAKPGGIRESFAALRR